MELSNFEIFLYIGAGILAVVGVIDDCVRQRRNRRTLGTRQRTETWDKTFEL